MKYFLFFFMHVKKYMLIELKMEGRLEGLVIYRSSCKQILNTVCQYLKQYLNSAFQLAGTAFIAIGFWAWSEKVCLSNMQVILKYPKL